MQYIVIYLYLPTYPQAQDRRAAASADRVRGAPRGGGAGALLVAGGDRRGGRYRA